MRSPLNPSQDCVICLKPLTERDLMVLEKSDIICQSWCEICMLKYVKEYPLTDNKRDIYYELQSIDRQLKYQQPKKD